MAFQYTPMLLIQYVLLLFNSASAPVHPLINVDICGCKYNNAFLINCSQSSNINFECLASYTITELILSNNAYTEVPQQLRNLDKLLRLDLSGNELTSCNTEYLPKTVMDLNLANNQITSLSLIQLTALYSLKNLINLDLSHNLISVFPVIKSQSLIKLDLSYNNIDGYPADALNQTTIIKEIILSHNRLDMNKMNTLLFSDTLEVLNVSHNRISWFKNNTFRNKYLPNIKRIDLSNNKLSESRQLMLLQVDPSVLVLNGNPFRCECVNNDFLNRVYKWTDLWCYGDDLTYKKMTNEPKCRELIKRIDFNSSFIRNIPIIIILVAVIIIFVIGIYLLFKN